MGYIMDLRKVAGHRPLMQVGASVIVQDVQGRILLQRRTDTGEWGYSGGSVELYEQVETAAARELHEETGLTAERLELFGIFSGEEERYVYPNGDQVSNVDVVYLCREYRGTLVKQEGEVEDLRWFTAQNIPESIFPPNRPAISRWLEEQKKN